MLICDEWRYYVSHNNLRLRNVVRSLKNADETSVTNSKGGSGSTEPFSLLVARRLRMNGQGSRFIESEWRGFSEAIERLHEGTNLVEGWRAVALGLQFKFKLKQ